MILWDHIHFKKYFYTLIFFKSDLYDDVDDFEDQVDEELNDIDEDDIDHDVSASKLVYMQFKFYNLKL